jgi:flagellar protein FlbT
MAGLILKLRPNEEFSINGAVIQNGRRKTQLRVKTDGASILRMRDAMRPEDATTPVRRAYYVAQLAVAGEIAADEAASMLREALRALSEQFAGSAEIGAIARAAEELQARRFYGVMRRLGEIARPEPAAQD